MSASVTHLISIYLVVAVVVFGFMPHLQIILCEVNYSKLTTFSRQAQKAIY